MENPIKMDELGVPLFSETSISCQKHPKGVFCLRTVKVDVWASVLLQHQLVSDVFF